MPVKHDYKYFARMFFYALAAVNALAVLLLILQMAEMVYASRLAGLPSASSFCRKGDWVLSCDMNMTRSKFPFKKPGNAFRVFVLGSSQAMGSPYVHQEFNRVSRFFPNEGGIATWLEDYFSALLPGKKVQVINATKANGRTMQEHLKTFLEISASYSPDLIIILAGNNEQDVAISAAPRGARAGLIARNYGASLEKVRSVAAETGIPVYLLTVPNNLRDWQPAGRDDAGLREIKKLIDAGSAAQALRLLKQRSDTDNALRLFYEAKCLDAAGRPDAALPLYVLAKDHDERSMRTLSVVNELIRKAGSKTVRVLDMERLFRRYAKDGIPGYDLFHDYCHMKLAANKYMAFEIADFYLRDNGFPPAARERLRAVPLRDVSKTAIRVLYWLKIVKWTEYYLLPRWLQELGPNTSGMIKNYRRSLWDKEMETIDIKMLQLRRGELAGTP